MSPHGRFDPAKMTDVQVAFMVALTDQRAANLFESADLIADMSEEAKEFLRTADKRKIQELEATLRFMNNTNIILKFLWIAGGTIIAAAVGLSQAWEWLSKFFVVRIK